MWKKIRNNKEHILAHTPNPQVSCVSRKFSHNTSSCEYSFSRASSSIGSTRNGNVVALFSGCCSASDSFFAEESSSGKSTKIYARDTLMWCEWGFILGTWSIEKEILLTLYLFVSPPALFTFRHRVRQSLKLNSIIDSIGVQIYKLRIGNRG